MRDVLRSAKSMWDDTSHAFTKEPSTFAELMARSGVGRAKLRFVIGWALSNDKLREGYVPNPKKASRPLGTWCLK